MQITIIYTTNSGGTFRTAQIIKETLSASYDTSLVRTDDVYKEDLLQTNLIIIGSPSWDFKGKEGSPTAAMMHCMERLATMKLNNKPFVVFGCGDSTYTHFCGAVDELERFVATIGGTLLYPSLKVDGYFFNETKNAIRIQEWARQVKTTFEYYIRNHQRP